MSEQPQSAEIDARCSCGNAFDGDNFCIPSACQWEGLEPNPDSDALRAALDALVERIRLEADVCSRAGQYARLNAIADDLAALATRVIPPALPPDRP